MNQAIIEGIEQRKMCEEREIADLLLWTIKEWAACVVDVGAGMVEPKAFSQWTKYSILSVVKMELVMTHSKCWKVHSTFLDYLIDVYFHLLD